MLSGSIFKSLDHFMVFLFILFAFEPSLDGCFRFWTNPEIQDGGHSEMITRLFPPVTPSSSDATVKGDIFRHTIYPPSPVAIAFIFLEFRRGVWRSWS